MDVATADNDLFGSLMTSYLAQMESAMKISSIVSEHSSEEELSADFQTSEFCEKHGFVDRIVHRKDLRKDISNILSILLKRQSGINSESLRTLNIKSKLKN